MTIIINEVTDKSISEYLSEWVKNKNNNITDDIHNEKTNGNAVAKKRTFRQKKTNI